MVLRSDSERRLVSQLTSSVLYPPRAAFDPVRRRQRPETVSHRESGNSDAT